MHSEWSPPTKAVGDVEFCCRWEKETPWAPFGIEAELTAILKISVLNGCDVLFLSAGLFQVYSFLLCITYCNSKRGRKVNVTGLPVF